MALHYQKTGNVGKDLGWRRNGKRYKRRPLTPKGIRRRKHSRVILKVLNDYRRLVGKREYKRPPWRWGHKAHHRVVSRFAEAGRAFIAYAKGNTVAFTAHHRNVNTAGGAGQTFMPDAKGKTLTFTLSEYLAWRLTRT